MKNRLILLLALLPINIYSQVSDSIRVERRAALIIGNGNYLFSTLANPENDARAMSKALKKIGFDVFEFENLNQSQMKKAIDDFGMKLKNYDVGLFFYAGHGLQSKGYNYLIPVDADLKSEAQVEYDCVQADRILGYMEESEARVKIIILDACRNNPFERSWTRSASGRGLATMNAPSGTLIGYATSPGNTASDGSGQNGLYTSAILESISIPGYSIDQMFHNVARIVYEKSGKQQSPWIASSLTADFYFDRNATFNPVPRYRVPATDESKAGVPAQLYRLNGEVLSILVISILPESIDYYIPGQESTVRQELKSGISKVIYSDGHEEIFSRSTSAKEIPPGTNTQKTIGPADWQLVIVTSDKASVTGLKEVRQLKATSFWGGAIWSKKGLDACYEDLKKKAAALGCSTILITDENKGGVTSVQGIAYK